MKAPPLLQNSWFFEFIQVAAFWGIPQMSWWFIHPPGYIHRKTCKSWTCFKIKVWALIGKNRVCQTKSLALSQHIQKGGNVGGVLSRSSSSSGVQEYNFSPLSPEKHVCRLEKQCNRSTNGNAFQSHVVLAWWMKPFQYLFGFLQRFDLRGEGCKAWINTLIRGHQQKEWLRIYFSNALEKCGQSDYTLVVQWSSTNSVLQKWSSCPLGPLAKSLLDSSSENILRNTVILITKSYTTPVLKSFEI